MRIYTGGTFDLLHVGHVRLLQRCRGLAGDGGSVVVSLNTDEFVEEYKGARPVIPYAAREEMLRALRFVDVVVPNVGGKDSRPAIAMIRPNIIAVGDDWLNRDYYAQMGFTIEWLQGMGIELLYLPRAEGVSSTQIRGAL